MVTKINCGPENIGDCKNCKQNKHCSGCDNCQGCLDDHVCLVASETCSCNGNKKTLNKEGL